MMHHIRDARSLSPLSLLIAGRPVDSTLLFITVMCIAYGVKLPGCRWWRVKLLCPEREAPEASQQQRIGGECLAGERETPLPTHGPDTYLRKRTSSWGRRLSGVSHVLNTTFTTDYDASPAADTALPHPSQSGCRLMSR